MARIEHDVHAAFRQLKRGWAMDLEFQPDTSGFPEVVKNILEGYEKVWTAARGCVDWENNPISKEFADLSFLPGPKNLIRDFLTIGGYSESKTELSILDIGGIARISLENEWRMARFDLHKDGGMIYGHLLVTKEGVQQVFIKTPSQIAEENLLAIVNKASEKLDGWSSSSHKNGSPGAVV